MNKLVNPLKKRKEHDFDFKSFSSVTVKEVALAFVSSLNNEKRKRFKKMVEAGISCGDSIANLYNVDKRDFMKAVKEII